MLANWILAACLLLLVGQGSQPLNESPPVVYPVIVGVTITASDGTELDAADPIVLEPSKLYTFTAVLQRDLTWGDDSLIGPEVPDDWQLYWGANFGEFAEDPQPGNRVEWIAPREPGEVTFDVRLQATFHDEPVAYSKTFRIAVGDSLPFPDYAEDVVLVRFQDWCDDLCVDSWARVPPAAGTERQVFKRLNMWLIRIDPEVDVLDAVRTITWWPSVQSAEPDFEVVLFDEGSGSWVHRFPPP